MKKHILATGVIALIFPFISLAQTRFDSVVGTILVFLNQAGLVLIGAGVVFVAYGIFRYLSAGGDPVKRAQGGSVLFWGIIALAIMVSFWGLVNILLYSLFGGVGSNFQLNPGLFNPQ